MKNFMTYMIALIMLVWMFMCFMAVTLGMAEGLWWVFTGDFFHFVQLGDSNAF